MICGFWLIIFWVSFFTIMNFSVLDFDAGMNFMVSKYLALNGDYATYYNDYVLFDHSVQTGGVVLYLTVILNKLLGIHTINMQIVTTFFLCLLIFVFYLFLKSQINEYSSLVIISFIALSPYVIRTSVVGYGEIPMGLLMVIAILIFEKSLKKRSYVDFFCVGVLLGLGYLTKTVFLIIIPTITFGAFFDYVYSKEKRSRYYLVLIGGIVLPIVLFEIYKYYSLGVNDYINWWRVEFDAILGQSGLTDKFRSDDEGKILQKIYKHCLIYSKYFNMSILSVAMLYIAPGIYYIFISIKYKRILLREYMLYALALSYLGWWCILSPTTKLFPRRVLMGHILILLIFGLTFTRFLNCIIKNHQALSQSKWTGIIVALTISLFMIINGISNLKLLIDDILFHKNIADSTESIVNEVSKLPADAKLFGKGWLQAPVIGCMADRIIYDIDKINNDEIDDNSYYIYDISNYWLSPDSLSHIFDVKECYTLIFESGNQKIYKLNPLTPAYFRDLNEANINKAVGKKFNTTLPSSFRGCLEGAKEKTRSSAYAIWGWCFIADEHISFMIPLTSEESISGLISCNLLREDVYRIFKITNAKYSGFNGICAKNIPIESILIGTEEGNIYQWNLQINP